MTSLAPGRRLGPYEVVAAIGAGGMGEVYRARDTRLNRTVALKVLPEHLRADPDRRARFEREARASSSLNHPNICVVYDVGQQDGTDFIVMEYLEGETLADRLSKGPLPFDQVLRHGVEIAGALARAHRAGIVHRDLKPGNVMLTRSGAKLLDFGLAKGTGTSAPAEGISVLPTQEKPLTTEGALLGTFQYMAPEQLEGRGADSRTDIFALGLLLYEMATGRKAFSGTSQASLIAAILRSEPESLRGIVPSVPPMYDRLVRACLAKDPDDRLQSAHDVATELAWLGERGSEPAQGDRPRRERYAWGMAGVALGLLTAAVAGLSPWWAARTRAPSTGSIRFTVQPEPGTRLMEDGLALSPDGRSLAFTAVDREGTVRLWLRSLDDPVARPLAVSNAAMLPFWSPDSRFIAYGVDGKLMKQSPGRPAQPLADAPILRGGTWSRDGVILFVPHYSSGLVRVSSEGGAVTAVTTLDAGRLEYGHRYPRFLPDGKRFLFVIDSQNKDVRGIHLGSLDSKETVRLTSEFSTPEFLNGHLLFAREGVILSQPLDVAAGRLVGEARPVALDLYGWLPNFPALRPFAASGDVLAWRGGGVKPWRLVFLDRKGHEVAGVGDAGAYNFFRLSADGNRVVASLRDASGRADLWLIEIARRSTTRLTTDGSDNESAIWSPDGQRIIFASKREGTKQLFVQDARGVDAAEPLLKLDDTLDPQDVSPDGRHILYTRVQDRQANLMLMTLFGGGKQDTFVASPVDDGQGRFSPDGRYVAYASAESGRPEVYVKRFPPGSERWPISSGGGASPAWRRDGRELFYLSTHGKLMAVDVVSLGAAFTAGQPRELFQAPPIPGSEFVVDNPTYFDVMPDGQRFLMMVPVDDAASQRIHVLVSDEPDQVAPSTTPR